MIKEKDILEATNLYARFIMKDFGHVNMSRMVNNIEITVFDTLRRGDIKRSAEIAGIQPTVQHIKDEGTGQCFDIAKFYFPALKI